MNLERESGRIIINNIKKIKKLWVEGRREGGRQGGKSQGEMGSEMFGKSEFVSLSKRGEREMFGWTGMGLR